MTPTKAVAKKEETSVDLLADRKPIPGMEHFGADDLIVPFIKLIQGTSDVKDGRPGQFINTTTNKVFDSKEFIIITYKPEYVKFKKDDGTEEEVPQYRILAIDPETKWPVFIVARGTSIWPFKNYLNKFWQEGRPLYSALTGVGSVKKDNKAGKGVYHVLAFEEMQEMDDATIAWCYSFYEKYGKKMTESPEIEKQEVVGDNSDDEIKIEDIPM